MTKLRDKIEKLAKQGLITIPEYWDLLIVSYQLMTEEEKLKEYKKLGGNHGSIN